MGGHNLQGNTYLSATTCLTEGEGKNEENFVLYQPVLRSDRRRGYGVCRAQVFEGMHGSANTFGAPLKDIAEIVATIVCGG